MLNKKQMPPTSAKRKHQVSEHNTAPRLEGVVKNAGIKPVRKLKRVDKKV